MTETLLTQLRAMTTIVADSGDGESIVRFKPQDSTTNPSLIETAAKMSRYQPLLDQVLRDARNRLGEGAELKHIAALAFRQLAVAFGRKILAVIPGRVSTEVDARLSFDQEATVLQARDIIDQYERAQISRERVLIKIAATWQGIQAARRLEQDNIHCNLTLVFGIHQAVACAEANVTLISPFVGRILDWHRRHSGAEFSGEQDPGVQSVRSIYHYIKKFGYRTQVMAASFRNTEEICMLAGCDLATISPKLLAELDAMTGVLPRLLSPVESRSMNIPRIVMNEAVFESMHREDPVSREELTRGIQGFGTALESLELILANRLSHLGTRRELAAS